MAEYLEVVNAGPGWTEVRTSDGQTLRVEGNRNWRNNNPGNIEYGNFARSQGAIGTDGRFAVFPTYDAGRQAKSNLIFESPNYRNLSIADAINRYAPPVENNTQSYINQVAAAAGVPSSATMSSLTPEQRAAVLDAMQRVEGWRVGTINGVPAPATSAVAAINSAAPPIMRASAPPKQGNSFFAPLSGLLANVQLPQVNMPEITPQMKQGALAPLLGYVAGRTALWNAIMPSNIGAAPSITQGFHPGGTLAMQVSQGGSVPVTLMRSDSAPSRAFDAAVHSNQNMGVYRANRDVVNGPINQGSIDRAMSEGKKLVRQV